MKCLIVLCTGVALLLAPSWPVWFCPCLVHAYFPNHEFCDGLLVRSSCWSVLQLQTHEPACTRTSWLKPTHTHTHTHLHFHFCLCTQSVSPCLIWVAVEFDLAKACLNCVSTMVDLHSNPLVFPVTWEECRVSVLLGDEPLCPLFSSVQDIRARDCEDRANQVTTELQWMPWQALLIYLKGAIVCGY